MNILKITLSILLMMTSVSAFSQKSHKIKIFDDMMIFQNRLCPLGFCAAC